MRAAGILVTSAGLLIGCGARVGAERSNARGTNDAAAVGLQRDAPDDGGGPGVSPSAAFPTDDQASPPPDLTQGPTVWVGQTDRTATYPAGYDGGTVVSANAPTGPERVVLILDDETNPVIGTVTFGDIGPPPPAMDPTQPYPPAPTTIQDPNGLSYSLKDSWLVSPFPGFSYSLVSSTLNGNLLNLAFVPAQLWQGWCAIQNSALTEHASDPAGVECVCDGGACTTASHLLRHVVLTVSGDTMQGQLVGLSDLGPAAVAPAIRLRRVQ